MAISRATLALIHGAWHGASTYREVIPELAASGHAAVASDLPGYGLDAQFPVQLASLTADQSVQPEKQVDSSDSISRSVADLVIEGLANGRLWIVEPGPVWAGHGTLKPCVVCRMKIDSHEIQYDVPGPRGALPAHVSCYRIWWVQSDTGRKETQP